MAKRHLKRIAMPVSWPIRRKEEVFTLRPYPGSHKMEHGLAIATFLKEVIHEAGTGAEARKILLHNEILCNGKRLQDKKDLVGLLDVVSIPKLGRYYRIVMNRKGKIAAREIPEKEATIMIAKVLNKTNVRGGSIQVNLSNGRNFIAKQAPEQYKTGGSVVLKLPTQEIMEFIPLEKGMTVLLQGGKYKGSLAAVQSIRGKRIIIRTGKGETGETLKKYSLVCGREHPVAIVTESEE
ncbi:MAG TPA: 30S ribosomal protein S4e [Candidatus Nanoarchaeia archaeon]|nr:30S ribosomal protein S4e [Candidatus Nanoarchaeia archaeon]